MKAMPEVAPGAADGKVNRPAYFPAACNKLLLDGEFLPCRPTSLTQTIPMSYGNRMIDRITFNSGQCGGRPCIRGMRIRVKDVLDLLAAGVQQAEILEDYPYLEPEDIVACLEYAAAETDHPILVAR